MHERKDIPVVEPTDKGQVEAEGTALSLLYGQQEQSLELLRTVTQQMAALRQVQAQGLRACHERLGQLSTEFSHAQAHDGAQRQQLEQQLNLLRTASEQFVLVTSRIERQQLEQEQMLQQLVGEVRSLRTSVENFKKQRPAGGDGETERPWQRWAAVGACLLVAALLLPWAIGQNRTVASFFSKPDQPIAKQAAKLVLKKPHASRR
jgi:hypothetical protein